MSHFDRLPDATLRRILTFVMARNTVFYIDEFSCRAQDEKEATNAECKVRTTESMLVFHPTRDSENGIYICDRPMNAEFFGEFSGDETRMVTCPDRKDRRMYCKPNIVYPSQKVHVTDWVLVHSINRRVRDIGRQAFFQGKSIAMAITLPRKIEVGGVPFLRDIEVRRIALENIRDLTLTNLRVYNPSEFLVLPQRVRSFTNLEYCTCLVKSCQSEKPDINDLASRREMPLGLAERLARTGMPEKVRLYLSGMIQGGLWEEKTTEMQNNVYLWLQTRARLMQRQKERLAQGKKKGGSPVK